MSDDSASRKRRLRHKGQDSALGIDPTPTLRSEAWRAKIRVDVDDLRTQLNWFLTQQPSDPTNKALAEAVRIHLKRAQDLADRGWGRAQTQAASQYCDAARINLFRLAPENHLRSLLPNLAEEARRQLGAGDYRVQSLAELKAQTTLNAAQRSELIADVQAYQTQTHRDQARVRSFSLLIAGVTIAITVLAATAAAVGLFSPGTLPLCFAPGDLIVCPTSETAIVPDESVFNQISAAARPADTLVVEFLGMLGATLAAAAAIRNIRGSADPYSLSILLALLKLPTGSFTAFLGILFIRAGFIPGLSALDNSPQIIAYAVLLGYSQQLFTGLVDRQAQSVLAQAQGATIPPPPSRDQRGNAAPPPDSGSPP